jgi:hypothetical protein
MCDATWQICARRDGNVPSWRGRCLPVSVSIPSSRTTTCRAAGAPTPAPSPSNPMAEPSSYSHVVSACANAGRLIHGPPEATSRAELATDDGITPGQRKWRSARSEVDSNPQPSDPHGLLRPSRLMLACACSCHSSCEFPATARTEWHSLATPGATRTDTPLIRRSPFVVCQSVEIGEHHDRLRR